MGAFNRWAILTWSSSTRYTFLGDLPVGHGADEVHACLMELIPTLPANLARSLTWDQGREMALNATFTVDSGVGLLLLSHSPWQRPHQREHQRPAAPVLPQRTDLNKITKDHLDSVAASRMTGHEVALHPPVPSNSSPLKGTQ